MFTCVKVVLESVPCLLTDDGQIDFVVSGGRIPEIHPAPVHALVMGLYIVDQQLSRITRRAEIGA